MGLVRVQITIFDLLFRMGLVRVQIAILDLLFRMGLVRVQIAIFAVQNGACQGTDCYI